MKKGIIIVTILAICVCIYWQTLIPKQKNKIASSQIEIQNEKKPEPEQHEMFDKKYQVLRFYDEDVSFRGVPRYTRKIKTKLGLSAEELSANLIHAAWEMQKEKNAKAVQIFAYRPDDMERALHTAGMCILAPFGNWAEATNTQYNSVSNLKPVVELAKVYFIDVPPLLKAESNVVLKAM